ncbi:hypothetical protein C3492_35990 [Streptomyces sp. Ru62]|uniref:hypothetical protein n=1 Tax=Streptomyces sp. Ru62 TaxID=2080745 RepID=UPI000CDDA5B8|nr:hypothetical protein [Streptomyces sp. Ru62]POX58777.1 hypothetical protein C3492_35990 [Streptomyces sp. Ru62]
MRAHQSLGLALIVATTALTAGCAEQKNRETTTEPGTTASSNPATTAPAPSWEGKAPQEDAMRRATRALNAVEPDGASRVDEGMENLVRGLDKTYTPKENRPHTFDIACQAPTHRTLTLTLSRGDAESEWEVTCGDREADQFNIPAGNRFTARIPAAGRHVQGFIQWRLNTVAPADVEGCKDDIRGCEK